ncbi:DUF1289 domain-containing protein [Azospirillum sp. ST 5-10]|uniref:DUF1289 domain-containing protein n=1 Tax=unclassified Azospirillum TaxID=2630922 RepID=UPI003F4A0A82
MAFDENYVQSPCVRVCTLDGDGTCVGCRRTIAEIKAWGGLSPDGKRALLAELDGRRRAGTRPGVTPRG